MGAGRNGHVTPEIIKHAVYAKSPEVIASALRVGERNLKSSEDRTRMIIRKNPDGTKEYEVAFWKEGVFNEANYLLPIPQSEINKNALLEQNPGY